MTEPYQQTTDEWYQVSGVGKSLKKNEKNYRLLVRYSYTPNGSETSYPKTLCIVLGTEGASVYLHRRSTLHRIFPSEFLVYEKLLSHLEEKRPSIHSQEDYHKLTEECLRGLINAPESQDIEPDCTEWVESHDANSLPVFENDTSPGQSQCTSQNEGNTSEPPK